MADNGQVIWEDPPLAAGRSRPTGIWVEILTPLMERPNAWARVQESAELSKAHAAAANLNARRYKIPAGRWQFTSRQVSNGLGAVYARYLGPEGDEP